MSSSGQFIISCQGETTASSIQKNLGNNLSPKSSVLYLKSARVKLDNFPSLPRENQTPKYNETKYPSLTILCSLDEYHHYCNQSADFTQPVE